MTDKNIILAPDGSPAPEAAPIPTDAQGELIRQGALMDERQSYERIIEGLKIAADAAAHLVRTEAENAHQWRTLARNLDMMRRACVQHAGLGLAMKEKETSELRADPMAWKKARERFREGLVQTAGGMRQIATCHRGEMLWAIMAGQVEALELKTRVKKTTILSQAAKAALILPPGYSRH